MAAGFGIPAPARRLRRRKLFAAGGTRRAPDEPPRIRPPPPRRRLAQQGVPGRGLGRGGARPPPGGRLADAGRRSPARSRWRRRWWRPRGPATRGRRRARPRRARRPGWRARLVLGGDTGPSISPMPWASRCSPSTVPPIPPDNGPYGAPQRALSQLLPCSFCYKRFAETKACLLAIPPAAVVERALELCSAPDPLFLLDSYRLDPERTSARIRLPPWRPATTEGRIMARPSRATPNRLGELLVRAGKITQTQLEEALALQKEAGGRLGSNLVKLGSIDEDDLIEYLSQHFGVPSVSLEGWRSTSRCSRSSPPTSPASTPSCPSPRPARQLTLAMVDPTNVFAMDDVKFMTGYRVEPVVASESSLRGVDRALLRLDPRHRAEEGHGGPRRRGRGRSRGARRGGGARPRRPRGGVGGGAGREPRQHHPHRRHQARRLGHPHRALREGPPGALPHRRLALRDDAPAAAA